MTVRGRRDGDERECSLRLPGRAGLLNPWMPSILERWNAGRRDGRRLFRELWGAGQPRQLRQPGAPHGELRVVAGGAETAGARPGRR